MLNLEPVAPLDQVTHAGQGGDGHEDRLQVASLVQRLQHVSFQLVKPFFCNAVEALQRLLAAVVENDIEGDLLQQFVLQQGVDIESAFERQFAISFEKFEDQWRNHLKESISWFTYLSIHLYEILFVAAAALTIMGFIRSLLRKRGYEKNGEEDEES